MFKKEARLVFFYAVAAIVGSILVVIGLSGCQSVDGSDPPSFVADEETFPVARGADEGDVLVPPILVDERRSVPPPELDSGERTIREIIASRKKDDQGHLEVITTPSL